MYFKGGQTNQMKIKSKFKKNICEKCNEPFYSAGWGKVCYKCCRIKTLESKQKLKNERK